jgi:multidrug efflux pump subunit AcrA (membrane-fusion protein)
MDLVLQGTHDEMKVAEALNYLLKPVNSTVISSIKTITPVRKLMDVKSNANGIITYDTRGLTTISSRFAGRIERLFVKYNFQPIHVGQKLFEIYSPELLTDQRDLLYLLKSDRENSQLIEGAKEKLRLLGASAQQVNELVSSGKESGTFGVDSPTEGYIVNASADNERELDVREGVYVTAGQEIFKVASRKNVWAEFDLFSQDASRIKVKDPIQVRPEGTPDKLDLIVSFVQPFFKDQQNFTRVRVNLPNTNDKYRIGQLVSASFNKPVESMWIPVSAQLDLGTRKVVLIKRDGVFMPAEISIGNHEGDWIEVLKGLDAADSIAEHAQFMIDSESFIKIKR